MNIEQNEYAKHELHLSNCLAIATLSMAVSLISAECLLTISLSLTFEYVIGAYPDRFLTDPPIDVPDDAMNE